MIAIRIWAMLAVALVACAVVPPPDAPLADVGEVCTQACAHRAELGCLEAQLAPMCLKTCILAAQRGLYSPACVVRAETREALVACRVRCSP